MSNCHHVFSRRPLHWGEICARVSIVVASEDLVSAVSTAIVISCPGQTEVWSRPKAVLLLLSRSFQLRLLLRVEGNLMFSNFSTTYSATPLFSPSKIYFSLHMSLASSSLNTQSLTVMAQLSSSFPICHILGPLYNCLFLLIISSVRCSGTDAVWATRRKRIRTFQLHNSCCSMMQICWEVHKNQCTGQGFVLHSPPSHTLSDCGICDIRHQIVRYPWHGCTRGINIAILHDDRIEVLKRTIRM